MRSGIDVSPNKAFEKLIKSDEHFMVKEGAKYNKVPWIKTEESDYAFPVSMLKKRTNYSVVNLVESSISWTSLYTDYDLKVYSTTQPSHSNFSITYNIDNTSTRFYRFDMDEYRTNSEYNYVSAYINSDGVTKFLYLNNNLYKKDKRIRTPDDFKGVPWDTRDADCDDQRILKLKELRSKHYASIKATEEDVTKSSKYHFLLKDTPVDVISNSERLLIENEIDTTEYYKVFFSEGINKLPGVRFCPWVTYLDLRDMHDGYSAVNYVSSNNLKSILYGKRDELDHIRNKSKESNRLSNIESWVLEEFIESNVELDSISTSNHPTLNSI